MKVCGFTIVRNAIKYGYPVLESIKSILPLCDQMVVVVGKSEDDTLNLIRSIENDKVVIVESVWDDNLRSGGRVLAVETDKAFDVIGAEFDWCFYIQADEVVHEKYLPVILKEMEKWIDQPDVEGLLLNYLHFWGTYDYVGVGRQWYRREIRIIKNNKQIRSYKDAQGFRINNQRLHVKHIDAYIYHYGWVRPPDTIKSKMTNFNSLYFSGAKLEEKSEKVMNFDYSAIEEVSAFNDSHPMVMEELVRRLDWHVKFDAKKININLKDSMLYWFEKKFGYRLFEYKNYKIIP